MSPVLFDTVCLQETDTGIKTENLFIGFLNIEAMWCSVFMNVFSILWSAFFLVS